MQCIEIRENQKHYDILNKIRFFEKYAHPEYAPTKEIVILTRITLKNTLLSICTTQVIKK